MNIVFLNNGLLSSIDITTMGDSCKRDDESKIGRFDSGLKYAIAILYRHGVKVDIRSGANKFNFSSKVIADEGTGKKKEVLTVNELPTAFSPQLGIDWKLWMAYRELYANCLDEGGEVVFTNNLESLPVYETVVVLHSCDYNVTMIRNWDNYFLNDVSPLYADDSISIYPSNGCLRLYKNGILVYKDVDRKALYSYDYKNASIDERRILNDTTSFGNSVTQCLMYCTDLAFIEEFFSKANEKCYEKDLDYYWSFSEEWVGFIKRQHKEKPIRDNNIFPPLFKAMLDDKRIDIGVRNLKVNTQDYYFSKAIVEVVPTKEVELSFSDKIKELCNFEIKYEIVQSSISTYKCLPDLDRKVIYVTKDFSKEDVWQLIKAQFRIEGNDCGNYVYKQYVKLLDNAR